MKRIKGKDLLKLGFNKFIEKSTLDSEDFHYYVYSIKNQTVLISCSNDERKNCSYDVEFCGNEVVNIINLNDLKKLIKIFKRIKTK